MFFRPHVIKARTSALGGPSPASTSSYDRFSVFSPASSPSVGHWDKSVSSPSSHGCKAVKETTSEVANNPKKTNKRCDSTSLMAAVNHVTVLWCRGHSRWGRCVPDSCVTWESPESAEDAGWERPSVPSTARTRRHGRSAPPESNNELVRACASCTALVFELHTAGYCGRSQRILWDVYGAVTAAMQHHFATHDNNINTLDLRRVSWWMGIKIATFIIQAVKYHLQ